MSFVFCLLSLFFETTPTNQPTNQPTQLTNEYRYVVLLLAHHMERFQSMSHLVIDEVHERSIDTDILCLLARRLLHAHPAMRLVLMSATVAAALYQQYFGR